MTTRADLVNAIDRALEAFELQHPGVLQQRFEQSATVEQLADQLTGPLLRRALQEEMTRDLGPYYDTAALMRRWTVSKQAVSKRHVNGTLLALEGDDGTLLYPVWQFKPGSDDYPIPLESLAEVRSILAERNADPLSQAIWLTTPVFGPVDNRVPAYRLLWSAQGAQAVRSAARAEVLRLEEAGPRGG